MDAHAKYVLLDRLSHIILTIYSVALLGFSVFSEHFNETVIGPYQSDISVVLSLSVLCASLVIWGLGFGEKARDHRDCYLAIQRLCEEPIENDAKIAKYLDILDRFPNHTSLDNERFLFRKLIIERDKLYGPKGPKTMPCLRVIKFLVWQLVELIALALVVFSPAIVIALIYAYA